MRRISVASMVLFLAGLSACGGGGGGGNSLRAYTGVRTAASLDNTISAGQFAYAILVPAEASAVGPGPLSSGNVRGKSSPVSVKSAVLRAVRRIVLPVGNAASVRSLALQPRAVYSDTVNGLEGGTARITVSTSVWQGGTEYVTRIDAVFSSFDDTTDGISDPIDGTMSIVPETWYGDGTPVLDVYVASFDLHVSLDPGTGGRISGTLDYRPVSGTDPRHVSTWNDTLLSDDRTGIQIWWNPLVEVDEDVFTDKELLTITGTVYISVLGYVTVSPVDPFDYPTSVDLEPVSGKFLLTGNQDIATVTIQGTVSPEVLIELDRGGDGTIDSTAQSTWQDLAF